MSEEVTLASYYELPAELRQEVLHFIEFLRSKTVKQAAAVPNEQIVSRRLVGSALGQYTMSDDFNEPLDDFKEYM